MRKGGELESGMPPDNNQIAQRSVRGNQIPPIGRLSTDYLPAGTPETGYAFRGAKDTTEVAGTACHGTASGNPGWAQAYTAT